MIENLETLLDWSPALEVEPGRFVSEASPNSKFWDVWRSQKSDILALGIKVSKPGGNWLVQWSRPEAFDIARRSSVTAVPSEVESNHVAKPLDVSIAWSPEQSAIFEWFRAGSGNLVVRARAGTGKTTTIKAAFSQAPEAKMLYAVFNKKNQREAQEKITDPRVEIKTLHSLGFAYILRVWSGVKPDDNVEYDRIEAVCGRNLADEVKFALIKLVGFAKNTLIVPTVAALVEIAEERQIDAENFESAQDGGWTVEKLAEYACRVMEIAKQRDPLSRISFNDMVWLPVAMGWVRAWFDLVCVDEAQDMNAPQLEMARLASKGRICVVGDDRQAIYGFRGAVQDGIDMMKSTLSASELGLTVTRRCPKLVVSLAVDYVPDFRAANDAPEGIVGECSHDTLFSAAKPGDAILSRLNAPLMPICLGLLRKGTPARIEGRDIGKMLLGIVEKLKAKSVPDFCAKAIRHGDRQKARVKSSRNAEQKMQQIDDQVETLIALAEGAANVAEIKSRCISLFQDSDNNPRPSVVLSSTHKAKGLEWDKVFILRSTYLKTMGCEEQNIFYVAITRSKHELVFVNSEQ
jgi:hypothetical protein